MKETKVGIVGSRTFTDLEIVKFFIDSLSKGSTVVSGGARGVDSAALEYAKKCGLRTKVFLPDLKGIKSRHEVPSRYYARNQRIVDFADRVVAFTEKMTGGAWDSIRRAQKAGKRVMIFMPRAGQKLGGKVRYYKLLKSEDQ